VDELYTRFEITTGPIVEIEQVSLVLPPISNCPLNVTVRSVLWLARVLEPPELIVLFEFVKVNVVGDPLLLVKFILPMLYWLSV